MMWAYKGYEYACGVLVFGALKGRRRTTAFVVLPVFGMPALIRMPGGGCKGRQAAFVKRPGDSGYASCIPRIEEPYLLSVAEKTRFE